MADLTAPIDAEKPELFIPHGPKEPIDRSGGLVEGVLDAVGKGASMFGASQKNAGVNEFAANAVNDLSNQNNTMSPAAMAFAQSGVSTLNKAQKAEDQGAMPPGTVGLHLQNFLSQAVSQHPNQAAQIVQYAHEQGFDSLMWQNVYNQQTRDKTMADAKITEQADNYKAGSLYAPADGSWSDDKITQYGAQVRLGQANMQAAKDATEAAAASAKGNQETYASNKSVSDDKLRSAANDQWIIHSTPVLDQFHQMVITDPDTLSKHPEYLTGVENFFEAQRTQLHSVLAGTDPSVIASQDKQIDDAEKGVKDFYTNYSRGKQQVLDNMKTALGVQDIAAFPIYSQLKGILGENVLNQVFGGMGPTLPKPMLDAMRDEFAGYGRAGDTQGLVAVSALGAMLKGQLKLQDVSQDQIKNVVSGAIVGVSAHTADINAGHLDPVNITQFTNATSTLIDAAYSIQPQGNPDIKTIQTASQSLSDPRVVAAVTKLANNPSTADKGSALLLGLRGANQHLLLAAKNANVANSASFGGSGPAAFGAAGNEFSVGAPSRAPYSSALAFDPKSGYWQVNSKGDTPSYALSPLRTQAKVLNDALNVLANTTWADQNLPQGATPLSLRKNYAGWSDKAGGMVDKVGLDELTNAKGAQIYKPQVNKEQDTSENRISKEEDTLKTLTNQTIQGTETMQNTMKEVTKPLTQAYNPTDPKSQEADKMITSTAPKYASISGMTEPDFTDLSRALAVVESGMGTNLKSPTGVHGIMQVTQNTAKQYGLNRDDPAQGVEAGTHYLADLIKGHGGNLAAALHAYNGGGDPLYASKVLNFYHQFQRQRQNSAAT